MAIRELLRGWEGSPRAGIERTGIDSSDWTGAPRPPMKARKLEPIGADPITAAHLEEYTKIAESLGVPVPDLEIERFKTFLAKHDIPVFNLAEVVSYMDKKAETEGEPHAGWEWRPLRAKDHRSMKFGREATAPHSMAARVMYGPPASDFYNGPARGAIVTYNPSLAQAQMNTNAQNIYGGVLGAAMQQQGLMQQSYAEPVRHQYEAPSNQKVYDKTVPLHALKKVALIEKDFVGDVAFFVCDYATLPAIKYPDPFLMAVMPNNLVSRGTGRFVIDFWDEPGFGIAKQIK